MQPGSHQRAQVHGKPGDLGRAVPAPYRFDRLPGGLACGAPDAPPAPAAKAGSSTRRLVASLWSRPKRPLDDSFFSGF